MNDVRFVVEQAGCTSCAARIETALSAIGTVTAIEIDEAADAAVVSLTSPSVPSEETVEQALRDASVGSGHQYGLRPGSWLGSPRAASASS